LLPFDLEFPHLPLFLVWVSGASEEAKADERKQISGFGCRKLSALADS
jgi:hypothetical protein